MSETNILVVEDERAIQNVIKTYLENAGYHVLCASDGLEGLDLFREYEPRLVILDLNLPTIDGMEVAASDHVFDQGRGGIVHMAVAQFDHRCGVTAAHTRCAQHADLGGVHAGLQRGDQSL